MTDHLELPDYTLYVKTEPPEPEPELTEADREIGGIMSCKYLSRDKNTDYVCGNAPYHTCQQWEDWTVNKFFPVEEMKDLFCEQQDENFVPVSEMVA